MKELGKPLPGERQFTRTCDICGKHLYREYIEVPTYNDTEWRWAEERHKLEDCVRHLAKQIQKLQKGSVT